MKAERKPDAPYDRVLARIEGDPAKPFTFADYDDVIQLMADCTIDRDEQQRLDRSRTTSLFNRLKVRMGKDAPAIADMRNDFEQRLMAVRSPGLFQTDTYLNDYVLNVAFNEGKHLIRVNGQYWLYHSGVFVKQKEEAIRKRYEETVESMREPTNYSVQPPEIKKLLQRKETHAIVGPRWASICATNDMTEKDPDPLGLLQATTTSYMNCKNTMLFFDKDGTMRQEEHSPDYRCTWQLAVSYNPEASTEAWDAFANLLFHFIPDEKEREQAIRHLEEIIGYILQSTRNIPSFLLIVGEPEAGKSTLARVMMNLLGNSAASVSMADHDGRNHHSMAVLVGKRMVIDTDSKPGSRANGEFLKKTSESDIHTADEKFVHPYPFRCEAMPVMVTNYTPSLSDHFGAIRRRLLMMEFKTLPADRIDREKEDALHELDGEALQGALTRAIEGNKRLQERYHSKGAKLWHTPQRFENAADEWIKSIDSVALFLDECTLEDPDGRLNRSQAYQAYKYFHKRNELAGKPATRNIGFINRINGRYDAVKDGNHYWIGVKLKDEYMDMFSFKTEEE